MKLFVAMGALNEGVIDSTKQILSTGLITVPNPYDPDGPGTVFRDWKRDGFGWIDIRDALSFSANTFFFHIGGGFDGQEGIGISNIEKYVKMFGFGTNTGVNLPNESAGVVPNPEWKKENFDGDDWRLGDTFLTAIGQYGFQATLLQLLTGTTAIVNDGKLFTPSIVLDEPVDFEKLELDPSDYKIVREGMYRAVYEGGTAHNLNNLPIKIGAKTGTAELGVSKAEVNSWITGFFPYDNPKYTFTIMMEKGSSTNTIGALYIASRIITWMDSNTPEYTR
jgi:penicillin-binding protein 2